MDGGRIDPYRAGEPGPYPGSEASPGELLRLAGAYRAAAAELLAPGLGGAAALPGRLCALHGVELHLHAFLLHRGVAHATLRGFHHDLGAEARLALTHGLVLRQRTAAHLDRLSRDRDYLLVRYAPDRTPSLTPVSRLKATLDEIARKVAKALTAEPVAAGPIIAMPGRGAALPMASPAARA